MSDDSSQPGPPHTESVHPQHDVLDGSVEDILEAVFETPVPERELLRARNLADRKGSPDEADEAFDERTNRLEMLAYQRGFLALIETAEERHFPVVTDAWKTLTAMASENERAPEFVKASSFVHKMTQRAADLKADPFRGSAVIDEVVELAEPVARTVLDFEIERSNKPRNVVERNFAREMIKSEHGGTAEAITLEVARRNMAEDYEHISVSTRAMKEKPVRTSDDYITRKTFLAAIRSAGLKDTYGNNLIAGLDNPAQPIGLSEAYKVVRSALSLAEGEDAIVAQRIDAAFEQVEERARTRTTAPRGEVSFGSIINIANVISKQLPDVYDMPPGTVLEELDMGDLTNLPAAFQRILAAVGRDTFIEATETPLEEESKIHLHLILVEAIAQAYADDRATAASLTVGDFVLRESARGRTPEQITRMLEDMEAGHEAVSGAYFASRDDSNVRTKRVFYNRNRPGYGLIS